MPAGGAQPGDPVSSVTAIATAALGYLARGWSVVPVEPLGKRPLVRWTAFQRQAADLVQAARWFARWPLANVGIVTGSVSGLIVLDVDPAHGGSISLHALEVAHGALDPTLEALTGGGGRHLYFRHPGGDWPNRAGFRPGLDLRGDGGVVVAPPSIHPSGLAYRWRDQRGPDQCPAQPMPAWLRAVAAGDPEHPGHPTEYWRVLVAQGVDEGRRNASLASLTGHLLWRGVDPDVVLELLLSWNRVRCRPALPDEEVAATVASIVRSRRRHGASDGLG